jgi:hypothetical protein
MRMTINRGLLASAAAAVIVLALPAGPANATGDCSDPIAIPPEGGDVTGTTIGGADEVVPGCGTPLAPERVYQWTPSVSGWAKVSACGTGGFDATVSIRDGGCLGPEVACDAQGCGGFTTFAVSAGATYWIAVDGENGEQGNFTLHVTAPGTLVTLIAGKKILIKDNADHTKRKIVFQTSDPAITLNQDFAPATYGATLQLYNGNGGTDSACFDLPIVPGETWSFGNPTQYQDSAYVYSACKSVQIKSTTGPRFGSIKVVCLAKRQPIDYSLDELSQGAVAVRLTAGPQTYCAKFGGVVKHDSGIDPPTIGGKGQFQAKDALRPLACPTTPSPCP